MNHKYIAYILLAGFSAALPAGCISGSQSTGKTPEVKTPEKPLTPKEIAAAKAKSEAEAKKKAWELEVKRHKDLEKIYWGFDKRVNHRSTDYKIRIQK